MINNVISEYLTEFEISSKVKSEEEEKVQKRIKECCTFIDDLLLNRIVYQGDSDDTYFKEQKLEKFDGNLTQNIIENIFVSVIYADNEYHADALIVFTTKKIIIFDEFLEATHIRIYKKPTKFNSIQTNFGSLINIKVK